MFSIWSGSAFIERNLHEKRVAVKSCSWPVENFDNLPY